MLRTWNTRLSGPPIRDRFLVSEKHMFGSVTKNIVVTSMCVDFS